MSRNSAAQGGGLHGEGALTNIFKVNIHKSLFYSNVANQDGGGGMSLFRASLAAEKAVFAMNSATNGNGGGLYFRNSNVLLKSVILVSNQAENGGAVSVKTSDLEITRALLVKQKTNSIGKRKHRKFLLHKTKVSVSLTFLFVFVEVSKA